MHYMMEKQIQLMIYGRINIVRLTLIDALMCPKIFGKTTKIFVTSYYFRAIKRSSTEYVLLLIAQHYTEILRLAYLKRRPLV